ncbi:MAG: DUF4178 domain-containing protein [Candidatus Gracilibacteria bacterium]|nr:DUF4178 domain-containing protein [Candidatus Gracilibacteria bacterium]
MQQCPSCGRPIKFEEKYTKIISCLYCNSILEFGGNELTKIGEQSEFINFPSLFQVGKTIEYKGKKIEVKGQLRYEYNGGFFDKFFVVVQGKEMFIREDDGTVVFSQDGIFKESSLTLIDKEPGKYFTLSGKDIFIQEVGEFELVSMKGGVKNSLIPGKKYEYLDGMVDGKMYYFEKEQGSDMLRISQEI